MVLDLGGYSWETRETTEHRGGLGLVFVFICGFPLYKLKLHRLFLSFTILLFTLKIHNLYKDLEKDKRAISFNTCGQTHTHRRTKTNTHSETYRHSRPSGPRFPVQHLARTAVCGGEETQPLIRRHSGAAARPLTRSTDPL